MHLIRLIYSSKARPDLGYEGLIKIRKTAVDHNRQVGISGILCYSDGVFLQALEGRRAVVSEVYHRIAADNRHSAVQVMSCDPISTRIFSDWAMKMVGADDAYTPRRRELMQRLLGMQTMDRDAMSGPQAFNFLRELVELERPAPRASRSLAAAVSDGSGMPPATRRRTGSVRRIKQTD